MSYPRLTVWTDDLEELRLSIQQNTAQFHLINGNFIRTRTNNNKVVCEDFAAY